MVGTLNEGSMKAMYTRMEKSSVSTKDLYYIQQLNRELTFKKSTFSNHFFQQSTVELTGLNRVPALCKKATET